MKILLVAPLFPPDVGVSTFRMSFFNRQLSLFHDVDVIKLGEKSDFSCDIKTLDKKIFIRSFFRARLNRSLVVELLRPILPKYDLVIVSATPYGLYEIAHAAKKLKIPYILDLRDLPDLTSSEQKGLVPSFWLKIKEILLNRYVYEHAKNAKAVFCVGVIATAITQNKLKNLPCKVFNISNGFNESDIKKVEFLAASSSCRGGFLVIGCVGNIHKFRETKSLIKSFDALNLRSERVRINHWGRLSEGMKAHINTLKNIDYVSCEPIQRDALLGELGKCDAFLLPCADDLIWEPTTSVFDYILFNKPVIFCGLRNNEAYSILSATNMEVLEEGDILEFDFAKIKSKSRDLVLAYSREFYLEKILAAIK